jgi:hypothetical protein
MPLSGQPVSVAHGRLNQADRPSIDGLAHGFNHLAAFAAGLVLAVAVIFV